MDDHSIKACNDILPTLQTLKNVATQRIRAFLLTKIHDLKTPGTNINLKQQLLLEYKYFQTFLKEHAPLASQETRTSYIHTQCKVYEGHFRTYLSNMKKLATNKVPDKYCLVGQNPQASTGLFAVRRDPQEVSTMLSLRNRHLLLKRMDDVPIVTHVAQREGKKFHQEVIFWSTNRLLMDTATSEYIFVQRFFNESSLFKLIFQKTIELFTTTIQEHMLNTYDIVGLLVMIRVLQENQNEMIRRKVPCLDSFFHRVFMDSYSKFKKLVDLQLHSVKALCEKVENPSPGDNTQTSASAGSPHYAVVRYAMFVTAILVLNRGYKDQHITSCLKRFRDEMLKLINAIAKTKDRKMGMVFLINNYDIILSTLRVAELTECEEFEKFQERQRTQIDNFIEAELNTDFKDFIDFVKSAEKKLHDSQKIEDQDKMRNVGKLFALRWKTAIQRINREVLHHFTPNVSSSLAQSSGNEELLRNCKELLQKILLQLLVYFTRFLRVVQSTGSQRLEQEFLSLKTTLKYEIRRLVSEKT